MINSRIKIGDLLVQEGYLSEEKLQQALTLQRANGGKLGNVLIQHGFVTREMILDTLAKQLKLPVIDLKQFDFNSDLVKIIPEQIARRYKSIVLREKENGLLIGMADPQDIFAFGELKRLLKKPLHIAIVDEALLISAFDMIYRNTAAIREFAAELSEEIGPKKINLFQVIDELENSDAPVAKLLQSVFEDASQVHASDIHIEPDESALRIRLRVDGVLQEQVLKNTEVANALTQRLKLMANLDISEKRLPQDGRFSIRIRDQTFDVRLSSVPTQEGEAVVMRLLDKANTNFSLEKLGMPEAVTKQVRRIVNLPNGLFLVTGPTGSGKTTTLYSILRELNTPAVKIITAEDPVEYNLERVSQIQVNPKIDLDFAMILRAALRQDPDILLVGEIRDAETAEIALRAAMTGHMVLATLHTNDAASTAMRLIDMGVEPFMVAVSLRAAIAQRLIRKICDACREKMLPSARQLSWLASMGIESHGDYYQGMGCTTCHHTGFKGRLGVYELLELNEGMIKALYCANQQAYYEAMGTQSYRRSLSQAALDLVITGKTSIDEAIKMAGEVREDLQ